MNTALAITKARSSAPPPLNYVLAGIEAAAGALQIATIASQKFHSGGLIGGGLDFDEVPIIAQRGEGILSRLGMNSLGGESNLNRLNSGERLNDSQQNNSPQIVININGNVGSGNDIRKLAEEIGFEVERAGRFAMGI